MRYPVGPLSSSSVRDPGHRRSRANEWTYRYHRWERWLVGCSEQHPSRRAPIQNPANLAAVTLPLPSGWVNTGQGEATLIPDVNSDGYPDFAIANAINPVPGAVVVFW